MRAPCRMGVKNQVMLSSNIDAESSHLVRWLDMKPTLNDADIKLLTGIFATKDDITSLRTELRGEIGSIREDVETLGADVKSLRSELKGDMKFLKTELKGEMASMESRLLDAIEAKGQEVIEEIATSVAKSILPEQEDHEKRITKLEKHAGLTKTA